MSIAGNIDYDHMANVMSASLVIIFLLVIHNSLVRRYFKTVQMSYFSSKSYPLILASIDCSCLSQLVMINFCFVFFLLHLLIAFFCCK